MRKMMKKGTKGKAGGSSTAGKSPYEMGSKQPSFPIVKKKGK